MTKILEVRMGGAGRERLVVRVSGRERTDSPESDDRNWLRGSVEVQSGQFAGSTKCSLRVEDFADFRKELALLTDDCSATAQFKTMEDRLSILVKDDDHDRLTVTGHISDDSAGNRLTFRFATDRRGLTVALAALDKVIDEYSVR